MTNETNRPLPELMRELADRYDADVPGYPRGVVMVQAETVREWADEIERLRALRTLIFSYETMLVGAEDMLNAVARDASDHLGVAYTDSLKEQATRIRTLLAQLARFWDTAD
jgi:hypothetical protein